MASSVRDKAFQGEWGFVGLGLGFDGFDGALKCRVHTAHPAQMTPARQGRWRKSHLL